MNWIERIDWLDVEADEALVWVSDGTYECPAYAQPFKGQLHDSIREPLIGFSVASVEIAEGVMSCDRDSSPLGCTVKARVIDVNKRTVRLGTIPIQLDVPLPGDVDNDDLVSFSCTRLDFIC